MGDDTPLETEIKRILGELAGAASMCWEPKPSHHIFDSTQACSFVQHATNEVMFALKNLDRKAILAAQILGHQEAMRPLLEEWSKLNKDPDPSEEKCPPRSWYKSGERCPKCGGHMIYNHTGHECSERHCDYNAANPDPKVKE